MELVELYPDIGAQSKIEEQSELGSVRRSNRRLTDYDKVQWRFVKFSRAHWSLRITGNLNVIKRAWCSSEKIRGAWQRLEEFGKTFGARQISLGPKNSKELDGVN